MTVYNLVWAVVLIPLGALVASYIVETPRRAAWVCTAGTAISFSLAAIVLVYRLGHISQNPHQATITFWTYAAGQQPSGEIATFNPQVGVLVDGLSAAVLPVVALVALLVQLHSLQYLRNDAGLRRYFVVTSLFTFAMLGLVASPNLFQSLIFWEALTVASMLLVGHWWHRPAAAAAAKRLMLVMGVGDLALFLGSVVSFTKLAPDVGLLPVAPGVAFDDPFNFAILDVEWQRVVNGAVHGAGVRSLVLIACLLLVAALVKAAQVPFLGWLSGLSQAPTPVMALVCAVGPLSAGVYLIARTYHLFELAPHVLTAVAVLGAITAVVGAAAALAQTDIKKLLAYMSVAHVGLMMVGLGVGALSAAVFQLINHAWFGALLFLAVANIVAAYGTQDIRELGGARQHMPRTATLLLVGCASAAMVPLLAGFWSADSLIAGIIRDKSPHGAHIAGVAQGLTLVATAVAIVLLAAAAARLYFHVALGEPARRRGFNADRVRESPRAMVTPLAVLALLATAGGFIGIEGAPRTFAKFVYGGTTPPTLAFSWTATLLTAALSLAGVAGALLLFSDRVVAVRGVADGLGWLTRLAADGLHLEAASIAVATRATAVIAPLPRRVDDGIVDGVGAGVADAVELLGESVARGAQPRRLGAQLVGAVATLVFLLGALTLAATGHLPGVGAAR